ncbi:hypothetical protein VTL71DRAFT_15316 [Oculimacula yallundae]|uniref:Extracellular membrane protein CFEM domain-containing protein n=1 Tax=Oculimacula yallundae TaxID=86028 RepID=A0ABR4CIF5_9HELO
MRLTNVLSIFALASAALVQADLTEYLPEIPQCGASGPKVKCLLQVLSTSVCDLTNQTCICENADFTASTQLCLTQNCTVLESFQVANVSTLACGRDHPDKSSPLIYTSILGGIAFLCVILRLVSRYEEGGFNAEDYIMAFAGLCLIPFVVLGVLTATHAFGRNIWDVPTHDIIQGLKYFYWGELIYMTILGVCKISILMFYLRLFPSQTFKYWCISLLAVVTLVMVTFQFMVLFQCWPINFNWHGWKGEMEGKCLNIQAEIYASSSLNIILDVAILVLPLPWLFRLQIGLRRKINVILMFSLGIFIFIVSVVRISLIDKFKASVNPTWDFTEAIFWSAIEIYVAVIVPCLPAIRSFLSRRCPAVFGIDTRKGTNNSYEKSRQQQNTTSKSFKMVSITTSSGTFVKDVKQDTESGQNFSNSEVNFNLGDQSKGTVHTGITGGVRPGTSSSGEFLVPQKP